MTLHANKLVGAFSHAAVIRLHRVAPTVAHKPVLCFSK